MNIRSIHYYDCEILLGTKPCGKLITFSFLYDFFVLPTDRNYLLVFFVVIITSTQTPYRLSTSPSGCSGTIGILPILYSWINFSQSLLNSIVNGCPQCLLHSCCPGISLYHCPSVSFAPLLRGSSFFFYSTSPLSWYTPSMW